MLNKDWKDKFVEETDNDYAIKYFKLISEYEDRKDKDLSSFSIGEIIDFYKILSSRSFTFLANCNYSLVRYTRWCLHNSLVPDGQNHYDEIDDSIIMECLNHHAIENSIISYEDLIKQEDILENVSDACLVQAVFEGVCGVGYAELSNLHINQIQ